MSIWDSDFKFFPTLKDFLSFYSDFQKYCWQPNKSLVPPRSEVVLKHSWLVVSTNLTILPLNPIHPPTSSILLSFLKQYKES